MPSWRLIVPSIAAQLFVFASMAARTSGNVMKASPMTPTSTSGSPRAYRGTTVAGFPNLFLLLGPNTGLGHNSVVLMIEAQLNYVLGALEHLRRAGARSVEPREAAQRSFVAAVDRRMARTVWATGGCSSWYIDATGRNSTLWPGSTWRFRQRMKRFDADAYEVTA